MSVRYRIRVDDAEYLAGFSMDRSDMENPALVIEVSSRKKDALVVTHEHALQLMRVMEFWGYTRRLEEQPVTCTFHDLPDAEK